MRLPRLRLAITNRGGRNDTPLSVIARSVSDEAISGKSKRNSPSPWPSPVKGEGIPAEIAAPSARNDK